MIDFIYKGKEIFDYEKRNIYAYKKVCQKMPYAGCVDYDYKKGRYLLCRFTVVGSEQGGVRPVLIIQNDMGNRHSPTVICAAITSKMNKAKLPTHVEIKAEDYGIVKDSVILLEQVRTIDKSRLKEKVCHLNSEVLQKINKALMISLSLS